MHLYLLTILFALFFFLDSSMSVCARPKSIKERMEQRRGERHREKQLEVTKQELPASLPPYKTWIAP